MKMSYIIQLHATEIGSRPPIQSWQWGEPPEGFVICPEEFIPEFTAAKGFVDVAVENGIVTAITENTEVKEAWEAANPEKPPEPSTEETTLELLADQEYRWCMYELGLI
jgi:hypothetical protein